MGSLKRQMRNQALQENINKAMGSNQKKTRQEAPQENPLIDVKKPVTNPQLKTALEIYVKRGSAYTQQQVAKHLYDANFLIATLADQAETRFSHRQEKYVTVKRDSIVNILNCFCHEQCYLPAFTDWDEIRKWTKEEVAVWVMPSEYLWEFVLNDHAWSGVVINPGSRETAFELGKGHIQTLLKDPQDPTKHWSLPK